MLTTKRGCEALKLLVDRTTPTRQFLGELRDSSREKEAGRHAAQPNSSSNETVGQAIRNYDLN
eukprot:5695197-Amphidinium_carterae.1